MKIFVSYSRGSEAIAKLMVADLGSLGHEVWFDRELSGGQAWWEQILAAIRNCDLLVFLLNPQSMASVACGRERSYAQALAKPILPVQVGDGISVNLLPPDLAQRRIIVYLGGERAKAFALARAVSNVPPASALPNPLPEPPEVPASYLGALAMRVDGPQALSFQDQSEMLVDLRKALREDESRADADLLLGRLRKRRDLFAAIAEEIDALRERTLPPPPMRPEVPAPQATTPVAPPVRAAALMSGPQPVLVPVSAGRHMLWWFLPAGAVIGVLCVAYVNNQYEMSIRWYVELVGSMVVASAIAGLIAGRDMRSARLAAVLAVLGFMVFRVPIQDSDILKFVEAVVFGMGGGAIVGALAGRLWRHFRPD